MPPRRSRTPADATPPKRDAFDRLAEEVGHTRERVLEEFGERSGIREYLGGLSRAEAEARAMEDVEALLTPKTTRYTGGGNYVPDGEQYW